MMTAPLPLEVRTALRSIAGDLQDIPRDCIVDRAELLMWLRRLARRVQGVERMEVVETLPAMRTAAPHEAAQAVLGRSDIPTTASHKPAARTIMSRKGRAVRVETRSRQFELPFVTRGQTQ